MSLIPGLCMVEQETPLPFGIGDQIRCVAPDASVNGPPRHPRDFYTDHTQRSLSNPRGGVYFGSCDWPRCLIFRLSISFFEQNTQQHLPVIHFKHWVSVRQISLWMGLEIEITTFSPSTHQFLNINHHKQLESQYLHRR